MIMWCLANRQKYNVIDICKPFTRLLQFNNKHINPRRESTVHYWGFHNIFKFYLLFSAHNWHSLFTFQIFVAESVYWISHRIDFQKLSFANCIFQISSAYSYKYPFPFLARIWIMWLCFNILKTGLALLQLLSLGCS